MRCPAKAFTQTSHISLFRSNFSISMPPLTSFPPHPIFRTVCGFSGLPSFYSLCVLIWNESPCKRGQAQNTLLNRNQQQQKLHWKPDPPTPQMLKLPTTNCSVTMPWVLLGISSSIRSKLYNQNIFSWPNEILFLK